MIQGAHLNYFKVTGLFIGPGVDICHFHLPGIVNKDVLGFNVPQLEASVSRLLKSRTQGEEIIPQL